MEQVVNSFMWLVGIIALVLVMREIVCWYWKMNDTVSLLKTSIALHEETNEILRTMAGIERKDEQVTDKPAGNVHQGNALRNILLLFCIGSLVAGCAKTSADIRKNMQPVEYIVNVPVETAYENSYRALRGCVGGSNANGSFYSATRTAEMEYALNVYGSSNTILLIEMRPAPDDKTVLAVYGNSPSKPGQALFERWALGSTDCAK